MSPPPKPLADSDETLVCETANEPRVAWMLDRVGAGPRSNGFVAAWADGTRVTPPTAIVTAAAPPMRRRRRGRRAVWVAGMGFSSSVPQVSGSRIVAQSILRAFRSVFQDERKS